MSAWFLDSELSTCYHFVYKYICQESKSILAIPRVHNILGRVSNASINEFTSSCKVLWLQLMKLVHCAIVNDNFRKSPICAW